MRRRREIVTRQNNFMQLYNYGPADVSIRDKTRQRGSNKISNPFDCEFLTGRTIVPFIHRLSLLCCKGAVGHLTKHHSIRCFALFRPEWWSARVMYLGMSGRRDDMKD